MSCAELVLLIPNEVWSDVFLYLPTADRNSARLTCRRFYEACNTLHIHRKESIVFRGNINTVPAIQWYANLERRIWHIKLYNVHLTDYSILIPFLQKQGAKIDSLIIHNCKLADGILENMIESCENLNEVALIFDNIDKFCTDIFKSFIVLESRNIIRGNVTNFSLVIEHEYYNRERPVGLLRVEHHKPPPLCVTNDKFLRFFKVFPSIKQLRVKISIKRTFDHFSALPEDINAPTLFSFSAVHHQISQMRDQIEKLDLHFDFNPALAHSRRLSYVTLSTMFQIEMINLKALSLGWVDIWDRLVPNPFLHVQHLTHFTCFIGPRILAGISASAFLLLLLNTAIDLRSLSILSHVNNLCITRECFQVLVKSQLTTLSINANPKDSTKTVSVNFLEASIGNEVLPNDTLEDLNLGSATSAVFSLFTNYFRGLKKFFIDKIEKSIMQNIFQYGKELQYLRLHNGVGFYSRYQSSLNGWLRREDAVYIRQFDNLTHLFIKDEESFDLSELLLGQFVFPNLQSLKIELGSSNQRILKHNNIDHFWQAIRKLTQLEFLEVKWGSAVTILYEQMLAVCSTLTKLCYFIFVNAKYSGFDDTKDRQLFDACPSLRVIICVEHQSKCIKYFKDVIANSVLRMRTPTTGINEDIFTKYGII